MAYTTIICSTGIISVDYFMLQPKGESMRPCAYLTTQPNAGIGGLCYNCCLCRCILQLSTKTFG